MPRVIVEVSGGLVAGAWTDAGPVEVYVVDRDVEGRSEPGDWPGGADVKALGGLIDCPEDAGRVAVLLGEIVQECDYCEGSGISGGLASLPADTSCEECNGRGWWLPYAEPAPSPVVPEEKVGGTDPDGDEVEAVFVPDRVQFGLDVFTCPCGGAFKLEVTGRFSGFAFSADGFGFDDLDCLDTEALVKCEACRQTYGFVEWMDAAEAWEEERTAHRGINGALCHCADGTHGA